MYELRVDGHFIQTYADSTDAMARVRLLAALQPDTEIELIDSRTGRAFEVAASVRWREEIAARMR